jgi:hypothetical protein
MFVSGFFGMNTSDIRDIEANQTIYWVISIPVTLLTLLAAFAYGYKGDEITDWLHHKLRDTSWGRYVHRVLPRRTPLAATVTTKTTTTTTPTPPPRGFRRRPTGFQPLADQRHDASKTKSPTDADFKSGLWDTTRASIRKRGSPPTSRSHTGEAVQSSGALGKEESSKPDTRTMV